MKVRVRDRSKEQAWGYGWARPHIVTLEISDNCPVCSAKRGEPRNLNEADDGEYYSVDVWTNPCGHTDRYSDVVIEAAGLESEVAS